jgi:hypothetical protein
MIRQFPEIRISDPVRHEALAIFPLFAAASSGVEYELADEAIGKGAVIVEEISNAGSVPDLSVRNMGDLRVLFLEGEELVGAKQNRILNTSVLVAARAAAKIPVSCVEAGRWFYKSPVFGSGGMHSPSPLRRVVKSSVYRSLKAKHGYRSDQGAVWDEVARQQKALGSSSGTNAMHDTFEAHRRRLDQFREKLTYTEGAVGAAVAIGGKLVAVDLFDKATTCRKVWNRLLSGAVLEALEVAQAERQAGAADVERVLDGLKTLAWEPAESVGEGEDYRAQSPAGDHASALVLEGTLVHGSLICAKEAKA